MAHVQVQTQPIPETFTVTPLAGPFGSPSAITVGDINGDGDPGIVVTDSGLNQILAYANDGSAHFTRTSYSLSSYGTGPAAVAVGVVRPNTVQADAAVALSGGNKILNTLIVDTTPPQVTAFTPGTGQTLDTDVTQVQVQFSEGVQDNGPTGAHSVTNPASYVVRNTATNQVIPVAAVSYNATTFQATRSLASSDAPLTDGTYQITVKGSDPTNSIEDLSGNVLGGGTDAASTFTVDKTAPTATLTLTPDILWTANHQLVNVHATLTMQDAVDPHPTFTLVSITSNEPDSGTGSGDLANDIQNAAYGTSTQDFSLRAERSSTGTGRTYTVTYLVQDHAGNGRLVSAPVFVPLNALAGQSSIAANFNGTAINAGRTIWFNSVLKPSGLGSSPVTIRFVNQTISFTASNVPYTLVVPDSVITFSPSATTATTTFNTTTNSWQTTLPSSGLAGNDFLSALAYLVPTNLPGGIQNVTWAGQFLSDTAGVTLQWKWAAAVYTSFGSSYTADGVKPVDDNTHSQYQNSDHAGTPENEKSYVIGGATGGGGSNYTGSLSGTVSVTPTTGASLGSTLGSSTAIGVSALQTSTVTQVNYLSLTVGSAVSGSIAQAGQVNVYAFSGTSGQTLFFDVLSASSTGLHWSLTTPQGTVLFSSNFTPHDIVTLGTNGTYYLTVDARSGQTGSYQLKVWNVPVPTTTAVSVGSPINGSLTVPGSQAKYTFSGTAGQALFLDIVSNANNGFAFTVLNPNGSVLLTGNNQNQGNGFTLPATGTYTVLVSHGSTLDTTGAFTFEAFNEPANVPLTMPQNSAVSGNVTVPGQSQSYTFRGNLGQQVLFTVLDNAAQASFTLRDPNGNVLFTASSGNQLLASLPATGTYTLTATGTGDHTGTFHFQFLDQTGATAPTLHDPTFQIGDLVQGLISVAGQVDDWSFTGTAGQWVFFNTDTGLLTPFHWTLTDPSNQVVFADTFRDEDTLILPTTGVYHLSIFASDGQATGAYQFQVFNVPPTVTTPITVGQVVSGALAVPGQEDRYTFSGTAGSLLLFVVQVNDGSFDTHREFFLYAPDGSLVFQTLFGTDTFALPQTGTYTLRVDDAGALAATGTYQFQFLSVPATVTTPVTLNQLVNGTLNSPGERDRYTLTASAGQLVFLQFSSANGRLAGTLYAPDGTPVLGPAAFGAGPTLLSQSGTYTVEVAHSPVFNPVDGTGAYQFEVWVVPAPVTEALPLDTPFTDTLQAPGQTINYTFTGQAGQQFFFDVKQNPGHVTFLLLDPFGNTVGLPYGVLTLPVTGTYTLLAGQVPHTGPNPFFGTYQFQMQQVAAPTVGTADSLGTDFWLAFPNNTFSLFGGPSLTPSLVISAATDTSGVVEVPGMPFFTSFSVAAGGSTTVVLPTNVQGGAIENFTALAVHVLALNEVSVEGVSSLTASTDGFRALPTDTLGTQYELLTYPGGDFVGRAGAEFDVVATQDNTTVTIDLTADIDPTTTFAPRLAGVPYTFTLNAGQVYHLQNKLNSDLTGTLIQTDKPVAVFSGNVCANIPSQTFGFANYLIEQMPPVTDWGQHFVTEPLATRLGGDTVRVLAANNNTHVTVNGMLVATLNQGQFYQALFTTPNEISADQPVLVGQFSNSTQFDGIEPADPSFMLVPPTTQFLKSYLVATPALGFPENFMNVVAPQADLGSLTLDGVILAASQFTAIGTSGYVGAQIAVGEGTHPLSAAQPFEVFLYGFNTDDAYSFTGGYTFFSGPVATNLALHPQTATDLVQTPDQVQATVTDQQGNPVPNVSVTFQVTGANPTSGTATTDAAGHALFTYTGSQVGTDTVTATAGVLSATATVHWVNLPPTVTVTAPPGGSSLPAGSSVVLSGLAHAGSPFAPIVVVTVNGQAVDTIDAAGDYFAHVSLAAGSNVFTVTATDSLGETATATLTLTGTPTGSVDFSQLQDVTALARLDYSATTFNRHTNTLYAQSQLTNTSSTLLNGPIQAVFGPFTPPSVTLSDGVGQTPDGRTYLTFGSQIGPQGLAPGAHSAIIPVSFTDADQSRFNFAVTLLAQANQPPVFTSVPLTQAVVGQGYTYAATASDPNGDALSYRLSAAPSGMSVDAAGHITWTPTAVQVGTFQVAVVADDGRGGLATQQFTVTVTATTPNVPPVFRSLPATQVAAGGTYSYTPSVFDTPGDTFTFFLDQAPTGMTFNATTGQVSYPNAVSGTYAVTLRVTDSEGNAAVQSWTLTVGTGTGADSVTFLSAPPLDAVTGTGYAYLPRVQDAQNQPVTFSLLSGPTGMTADTGTGLLTWLPTDAEQGPQTVVLQADDHLGGTAVQTFIVTVHTVQANLPPVILSTPVHLATQNQPYRYQVAAFNPDGDTLQYALVGAPTGMNIDSNGLITWQPGVADVGFHALSVQATDLLGATATQTYVLEVRVPSVAPTFTSSPVTTATAGAVYRAAVTATDPTDGVTFSLVNPPAGMFIDTQSGALFWKPTTNDLGPHTIDIRATNDRGVFTDQTFTLTVNPDTQPPVVSVTVSQPVVTPGQTVTVYVSASDNVGVSSLTLKANGTPVTLTGGTATYTATAPGLVTFVATATDPAGNAGTGSTGLRVADLSDHDLPQVAITSPISNDTVTYLTNIVGTATDTDFADYKVEYAVAGTNDFHLLTESSTPVVNGVLAVFDPTLLQNNTYIVRVTAEDCSGNVNVQQVTLNLAGNAKIGTYQTGATDLSIPLPGGMSISLKREYDTTQADQAGDLGPGWHFCALEPQVRETVPQLPGEDLLGPIAALPLKAGDKIYLTNPDCTRIGFTFEPVPITGIANLLGDDLWQPNWVADPGVTDSLYGEWDFVSLNLSQGFAGQFDLNGYPLPLERAPDGTFLMAYINVPYNPTGFELIRKDGTRYHFSKFTGLEDITDRNGNTITVTPSGMTSSTGVSVQFTRDAQGRITQITDPAGNPITYSYDASGNLAKVENQSGSTNEYEDEDPTHPHFLSTQGGDLDNCGCPSSQPPQSMSYDTEGRLFQVFDALGAVTNTEKYNLPNHTEQVANGLGNVTSLTYDDRGNIVQVVSPLGEKANATYDSNDNLTSATDERGNTVTMNYDNARNMLSLKDALGFTISQTFNGLNKVTSQTDARGNTYYFGYDSKGNLTSIQEPGDGPMEMSYDSEGRVSSSTDFNGGTQEYAYGDGPSPTTITFADGATAGFEYNDLNLPTKYTDENGHTTEMTYSDSGQLEGITDPLGQSSLVSYVGNLIQSITNKDGQTTDYGYDANDRVTSVSGPMGYNVGYSYDANGNITSESDALGRVTTFQYDADGRETAELAPLGNNTYYTFDASGNITSETDGNGHTTHYTYDADNNVLSETDPLGATWTYSYDAAGNQTGETGPNQHTTTYVYDSLNRMSEMIDALGGTTFYSHDLQGNLLSTTDPNGHVTQNVFDDMNRLTSSTDPMGGVTRYQYDLANNLIAVTDPNGNTTHYGYDQLNRQISETDPAGGVWQTSYTPNDQIASTTDPLGRTTNYQYDALQRLTKTTDPTGATQSFTYDLMNNLTSETDPLGRTTQFVYNAADELVSETDPLGAITQYTYDAVANQTSVTDPNNNTTTFRYDAADQLVQQTDPLGHSSYFQYDSAGNLTQSTDRNGRVIQYGYDALDQQTSETWMQGGSAIYTAHYAYDPAGNLISAGDNNSRYTFVYDANDQVKSVDNANTPGVPHVILTYGYDANGNNTSVTDNVGVSVHSTYDARDLLVNRTWSGGGIDPASYSQHFNAAWQLVEQDRFGDTTGTDLIAKTLFTYDPAGRVQTLSHLDALGHVLANYQYSYDAAGQLTQEIHHGITFNYQYDKGGQLTTTTRSDQPAPVVQSFDANGNRTDSGVVVGADNRVLSDADFTYQYDNEGNLIQKVSKTTGDSTTYTYDFRNRLTDVTTSSAGGIILESEQYRYDVFNNRIAVTVNGQILYTVYDGENAWADYNADGSVNTRYLFGDNTDEIIARWQPGSSTAWYLTDQLGSIRDIINAAGQVLDHIDYRPFGAVLSETNPSAGDRFKFTGREYSAGTGLYYFRGRYFDPVQQRFINEDPWNFLAGDDNLYRYIGNQPTAGTDPYGSDALVERAVEYAGNLASAAAEAAAGAAIQGSFNLLEAWAQNRLSITDVQAAVADVQQAAVDAIWNGLGVPALQYAADVLNGPWQSAAYREELFRNISTTVVNSAFGLIMGPLGGALMTVAAPDMVLTQVYFNGIGAYEAFEYYRETGDPRLFLVRAVRAGYNIALTVLQWRLNLSPTCNCLGHCFPAGTLVSTETGQRPIETIKTGDRVWAMDLKDGQWKLRRVLETFDRPNHGELLALKVGDEEIRVTPGHPFWILRGAALESRPWPDHAGERPTVAAIPGRWVDAGELRVGDVLYLHGAEERAIEEIEILDGGQRVYNFRVEEFASYAVGNGRVLVHNASNLTDQQIRDLSRPDRVQYFIDRGYPASELGPSGWPKFHAVKKNTRKKAKQAGYGTAKKIARKRGQPRRVCGRLDKHKRSKTPPGKKWGGHTHMGSVYASTRQPPKGKVYITFRRGGSPSLGG